MAYVKHKTPTDKYVIFIKGLSGKSRGLDIFCLTCLQYGRQQIDSVYSS